MDIQLKEMENSAETIENSKPIKIESNNEINDSIKNRERIPGYFLSVSIVQMTTQPNVAPDAEATSIRTINPVLLLLLKPHCKTEMFLWLLVVPNLWATFEKSHDLFLLRIK
jgi:hypothetical protein